MNESNNLEAIQHKLDGAIQYIFDEIEKSKQKLEKQLQTLLDFQQQLNDFLNCKDL